MIQAKLKVDSASKIGEVPHELFSNFVEHIGRAVYGGVYQPEHPTADSDGFRQDVIELVKELNVPYVRYPGGNFVSGYNWKNGIGPKENRPTLPDLAWMQMEPNQVGTDEFVKWCKKIGAEPMMAVNLGTGTPQEAFELLQYCNGTKGYWAELRKKNGHEEPYNIKYWCLGNEMDGEWQIGNKTAEEYAKIAKHAARMMKIYDPTIKLVFCGSSSFEMPHFPEWERKIITECFNEIDYISSHRYYQYNKKMPELKSEFALSCRDFEKGIDTVIGIIKEVKKQKNSDKNIYISMDEWNVWYQGEGTDLTKLWEVGPPREETVHTRLDAAVVASLIATLINKSAYIKMACMAQLVNVIAPVLTDNNGGAIKQSIYYPYMYTSKYANGTAYNVVSECDKVDGGKHGIVDRLAVALTLNEKEGMLLVCNLAKDAVSVKVDMQDIVGYKAVEMLTSGTTLENIDDKNTFEQPELVVPEIKALDGGDTFELAPYSWNIIRYAK